MGRAGDTVDIACSCYPDFNSNGFIGTEIRASVVEEMRKFPTALVKEEGAPGGSSRAVIFTSGMAISTSTSERMKLAMRGSGLRQGGACRDSAGRRYLPGAQREQGALEGHDIPVDAFVKYRTARLAAEQFHQRGFKAPGSQVGGGDGGRRVFQNVFRGVNFQFAAVRLVDIGFLVVHMPQHARTGLLCRSGSAYSI